MPCSANRRRADRRWSCAGEPYAIGAGGDGPCGREVTNLRPRRRHVAALGPAYGHDVDAQLPGAGAKSRRDRAEGAREPLQLLGAHAALRGRVVPPRLHLDGDPEPAAPAQDVDLSVSRAHVPGDDPESARCERGAGDVLARRAADGGRPSGGGGRRGLWGRRRLRGRSGGPRSVRWLPAVSCWQRLRPSSRHGRSGRPSCGRRSY